MLAWRRPKPPWQKNRAQLSPRESTIRAESGQSRGSPRISDLLAVGASLLAFVASSCANENPGIPPAKDTFYFPTGLAVDPRTDRSLIYVSNANADLRFNGGTLLTLDLSRLPEDLSTIEEAASLTEDAGLESLRCSVDRVDPTRWECDETQFVVGDASLRIGDFPGEVRVVADGTGARVFVPVRGQRHLLWADIVDLSADPNEPSRPPAVDLRCNSACASAGAQNCDIWDCDEQHQVELSTLTNDRLPAEPFGILVNQPAPLRLDVRGQAQRCRRNAGEDCCGTQDNSCSDTVLVDCCVDPNPADHIYLTHLDGGEVSFFRSEAARVELVDVQDGFFNESGGIRGGFSLASTVDGDPQAPIFVGSRVDNTLATFVIRDNTFVVRTARLPVGALDSGADVRGIAFDEARQRLLVVNRAPPALVAMRIRNETSDALSSEPLWTVELCDEPSTLRLGPDHSTGDPDVRLAYVVCFSEALIFVVDMVTAQLVDTIATGEGPNALELDSARRRAFVTNFAENTVGVIDLNAEHETYHKMVLRIGTARRLVRD